MSNADFDPSLHIIPLDPQNRTPVMFFSSKDEPGTLVAITDNGRISFFPIEADTVFADRERTVKNIPLATAILDRIAQRFPNDKDTLGNKVIHYLAVGVMYGNKEQGWAKFIFEVWGFRERFAELDKLYDDLFSLGGTAIGDSHYTEIEKYLSSDPVKEWTNQLISFLKEQLNWSEYVRQSLDEIIIPDKEDNKYAISFAGGDFKVRAKSDTSLWCLDSDYQPCVIVLPQPSYKLLDSLVTEYAEKHDVAATVGCKGLDTKNPIFMPVVMSIDTYKNYYIPLSEFMKNKLPPPKELAEALLGNIEFVEKDDYTQTIKLRRQAKNLGKGDLFTRDKEGNRVEIYVTHLLKTEKPYSIKEIYTLKFKNLFRR
jgi:hypothetical protein